jgi:hypothetical protein
MQHAEGAHDEERLVEAGLAQMRTERDCLQGLAQSHFVRW